MSDIERRKYVFAQLKSLPNAFQYVEVSNYIEELEDRIIEAIKLIDDENTYFEDGENWENVLRLKKILQGGYKNEK